MSATIIILASILSGIFYRLGGAGKHGQWYAFILDGKLRDIFCSVLFVCLCGHFISWHWTLIPSFVLMWAALTTYWKKSRDARWVHWLAHGFGVALAILPFIIVEGLWLGFAIRCLALPVLMMLWTEFFVSPVVDELGRGFFICATFPLLLL